METELLNIESVSSEQKAAALRKAGEIIREGGLVAFPTETVYGLGADALNAEAAAKIYAAKGRPSDNPLIVHIHDISQVYEIAEEVPDEAKAVMEKFWPGPLTIILNKKSCVPDGTTGGLHTVGDSYAVSSDRKRFYPGEWKNDRSSECEYIGKTESDTCIPCI